MPTNSFDTFFACTILVVAALVGMAFLGSTLQTRIASTQDTNKDNYLKALADRIVTKPGVPINWGTSSALPSDFGLASSDTTYSYQVDIDKITRLNGLNNYSLSYAEMLNAAQISNIAIGVSVSQLMTVKISQLSNSTFGSDTIFIFQLSTSIDSKPTSATIHGYIMANNYLTVTNESSSIMGVGTVTIQIPSAKVDSALLIVFVRASFDDRVTAYGIYSFVSSIQEAGANESTLVLNPINHTLDIKTDKYSLANCKVHLFSYSDSQNLFFTQTSDEYLIPNLIDKSPSIIVVGGFNDSEYVQIWIAYPQVPMKAGADFENQEQNIFSYIVTIKEVLYRLELSLGDTPR